MKKINLSNWSINLLKADNRQWFKGYVLGEWEKDFKPYFAIWEAFASCMDSRAKLWDFNTAFILGNMEKTFKENGATDDEVALASLSVSEALNNFRTLDLPKPIESEKEVIVELNDKYNLKVKFDAFYGDYILDHKKEEQAFQQILWKQICKNLFQISWRNQQSMRWRTGWE